MSTAKRMPPARKTKPKDEVNKKALIWIGSIAGVIIIAISALLIINQ